MILSATPGARDFLNGPHDRATFRMVRNISLATETCRCVVHPARSERPEPRFQPSRTVRRSSVHQGRAPSDETLPSLVSSTVSQLKGDRGDTLSLPPDTLRRFFTGGKWFSFKQSMTSNASRHFMMIFQFHGGCMLCDPPLS